jgi:hypothetical protein
MPTLRAVGGLQLGQRKGRFVEEIVEGLLIDLAVAVIGIVVGRLLKKLGVLPS